MIWIVLLVCLALVSCNETNKNEDKLIFAQIIFRHGDRTIRKTYKNDPYRDNIYWPEGFGQLTNLGKHREYQLGKFLRRRYDKFLGPYSPKKLHVLSSDYDRTINSANLVLAGMFPPADNQIWNKDLLWQPIAVHSIPRNVDDLIYAEIACGRYPVARKEFEQSPEIKSMIEQNEELFEYLEEHTGQPVRRIVQLRDIYEALNIEYGFNKTLPEWTRRVFVPGSAFENLSRYWFTFITGTPELKRLKSGFLMKEIFDIFTNKTLALLPDKLMQMYSGHDTTIAAMLSGLGIFELHDPPYACGLIFELYESNGSHYVQIFYRKSTAEDLTPIDIPNCGRKCPLNQLYELYKEVLPVDFETECQV